MKYYLTILFCIAFFQSYAQTENDSLVIYNNALRVLEFYNENPHYKLQSSKELIEIGERKDVFEMLENSRRMYHVLRRAMKKMSENPEYKDLSYKEYYSEIDEHRFYQRELENQIVNSNAPFPMYDDRILPVIMNIYINEDSNDIYFGDLVQIPLYVPVVVKPFVLLTDYEIVLRNKILHIVPNIQKFDSAKRYFVKRDTIIQKRLYREPRSIYIYNEFGTGCLIGFMYDREFRKIKQSDFVKYAVPKYAQEILLDDERLKKMLRIKFGEYFLGLID